MSTQHETPEQAIEYVLTNLYQDQRTQLIANMQNDTTEIGQAFHQFITSQNSTAQSSSNAPQKNFNIGKLRNQLLSAKSDSLVNALKL